MPRARLGAVIAAVCAAAGLSGCSPARSANGPQRPQSRDDVICSNEAQTGSHIVETRCLTRGEIDDRRKADKELLERAVINANRPVRPQPGQTPSR